MTIEIKLRQSDDVALIDERDADLAGYTWSCHQSLGVIRYDATRYDTKAQRTPQVLMSRLITQAPSKWRVIHLDGNRLNNQRGNLLLLSGLQYAQFVPKKIGTSGYIGVIFYRNAYEARIQGQYIARFPTAEAAARAYDAEAMRRFGPSARLNFPRAFVVCHEYHRGFFELSTATMCSACVQN